MAKDLGIRIKVDFPDVSELQKQLESKLGKNGLKVKVNLDAKESIGKLTKQLTSAFDSKRFKIKVDIADKEVLRDLSKMERNFQATQARIANSLGKGAVKGLQNSGGTINGITKNSRALSKTIYDSNQGIKKIEMGVNTATGAFSKLIQAGARVEEQLPAGVYRATSAMSRAFEKQISSTQEMGVGIYQASQFINQVAAGQERVNSLTKEGAKNYQNMAKSSKELNNSEKRSMTSATNKTDRLKEIASIMKQIDSLELDRIGADHKTAGIIEQRIKSLQSLQDTLQKDFMKATGIDSNESALIKDTHELGEYRKALREVAEEKAKEKSLTSKSDEAVKEMIQLENERLALRKRASTVGSNEAEELEKQAAAIDKKITKIKESNRLEHASEESLRRLNNMYEENARLQSRQTASQIDKQSSANLKELEQNLKQVYALQNKINEIQTQQKHGVAGKDSDTRLAGLEQELKLVQEITRARLEELQGGGKLTTGDSERLNVLKAEHAERLKLANVSHETNAKLKADQRKETEAAVASRNALKEQVDQLKKIDALYDRLSSAGRHEAQAIEEVIRAEEKHYQVLKKQANVKKKMSPEHAKELANIEKESQQTRQQKRFVQRGKQLDDDLSQYSLQQMFNPQMIAGTARMAFETVLESVGRIDEQLVNIAKVADVPSEVMQKFGDNVYDFASEFGVSADGYAAAVERWITTGKTLSESIELANASVMGSFVGNIGEEEMVKYMAVPLNAWKDSALEANDVINAMNEVSNNNAIEMNDLGTAYERAAATASQAGTSFAELTGMITGAQEATRAGGEKIGTALKAMDVNFGKIGAQLTKGDTEKFEFLSNIGAKVTDENGKLRSTYEILNDLSKVWGNLSELDKSTAGSYIAGKNHSAVFAGMMKQWDTVKKAASEAQGQIDLVNKENGSAFQEFDKQKNSIAYAQAQMKNAWDKFLNSSSGGKNGVISVLNAITKGLQTVTKLAQNPAIQNIGKSLFKATAIMTATTAVSQFFKLISAGTLSSIASMGKLMTLFTKTGREARKAAKIKATADATEKVGSMGGMFVGASKLLSIGSKIIPVIGAISTAISLLEMTGIPVWENLGKGLEFVKEKFGNTGAAAKKANEEFVEAQKTIQKHLDENVFSNGKTLQADEVFKTYNQLVAQKQKQYDESGDENVFRFSDEEFQGLKRQFDATAESLGVDIKLEMNDYDDIKSKFQELLGYKEKLSREGFQDQSKEFFKANKQKDLSKDLENFNKKRKEELDVLDKEIQKTENTSASKLKGYGVDKEKQLASLRKKYEERKLDDNFFGTKGARDALDADRVRLDTVRAGRSRLKEQMIQQPKTLQEQWNGISRDEQKYNLAAITAEGREIAKTSKSYQGYVKELQSAKELRQSDPNKKSKVSADTLKAIQALDKEKYGGLGAELAGWEEKGIKVEDVLKQLEAATAKSAKTNEDYKNSLAELGKQSGMSEGQIKKMTEALEAGNMEYAKYMTSLDGTMGADMLGIGAGFVAKFGEDGWKDQFLQIQQQVEDFSKQDLEKAVKLKIVKEDGMVNGDMLEQLVQVPDEIQTKFKIIDESGNVNLKETMRLLDQLKDTKISPELKAKIGIEGNGELTLEALIGNWDKLSAEEKKELLVGIGVEGKEKLDETKKTQEELDGKETESKHKVDTSEADGKAEKVKEELDGVDGKEAKTSVTTETDGGAEKAKETGDAVDAADGKEAKTSISTDTKDADGKAPAIANQLEVLNGTSAQIKISGENSNAVASIDKVRSLGDFINLMKSRLNIDGENSGAMTKGQAVKTLATAVGAMAPVVTISANTSAATSAIGSLRQLASLPIVQKFTIVKETIENIKKVFTGHKSVPIESSAVINPALGRSLSVGIGSAVGQSLSMGISKSTKSNSDYKRDKKDKPDEDIWRYWAKELFKGLPLERTMSDLNNSIKKAGENQDKLISLYKEQNAILSRQEAYQKEMRSAKQDELNSVLGKLRGDGFKTRGNDVTNLDRVKSFSGDKLTEVNENLRKYKDLYKTIDDLTGKINSISVSKYENQENIKKAEIAREQKALEKNVKQISAVMTMISNRNDIQDKKVGAVSQSDYELKLMVSEEGANLAANNIEELIGQYNLLAKTSIKHAENAEAIKGKMSDLKGEILKNADAVIQYRTAMNDIRIERLVGDFGKFNDVVKKNIGYLDKNISMLKDGLVEGTNFKDLTSRVMDTFMPIRKSRIEKDMEKRLRLEDDLNKSLEAFDKKNVERKANVANAILDIEKNKYDSLLKMQKEYTNGYVSTYRVNTPQIAIGRTAIGVIDESYRAWTDMLTQVNSEYAKELKAKTAIYDEAIKKANSAKSKEAAKNRFIIAQMRIQEKMYRDIVTMSEKAASRILEELDNKSLTTDQRNKLKEEFARLKDESISAQEAIAETVKKRYEFAFELIDEATKRFKQKTDVFEKLLAIAHAANMKPLETSSLIKTVFSMKAQELAFARDRLAEFIREQDKLTSGSLEWNMLANKIEQAKDSVQDLTVGLLEANKAVLDNQMKIIEENIQKGLLSGKTLEEYQSFKDKWFTGVAKELELEKMRVKAIELENDAINKKLAILDRQEKLSKRDAEYLDKQMKVAELEKKLSNLDKERNVQTIARRDDGTWGWDYVKDMTEYDRTKDELLSAKKELVDYKDTQRESYVSDMAKILQKAKDSGYENAEDIRRDIAELREAYKTVLDDIPEMNFGNIDEFIAAYDSYLKNNKYIISELSGVNSDKQVTNQISALGEVIENSFKTAATDIIQVVTSELRNALRANGAMVDGKSKSVVIQSQELSFPNVTDAGGIEEVFLSLPDTVNQRLNNKW